MSEPNNTEKGKSGAIGVVVMGAAALAGIGVALSQFGVLAAIGVGILTMFAGAVIGSLASGSGLMEQIAAGVSSFIKTVGGAFGVNVPSPGELGDAITGQGAGQIGLQETAGILTPVGVVIAGKKIYSDSQKRSMVAKAKEVLDSLNHPENRTSPYATEAELKILKDANEHAAKELDKKTWFGWGKKSKHGDTQKQIQAEINYAESANEKAKLAQREAAVAQRPPSAPTQTIDAAPPAKTTATPTVMADGTTQIEVGTHTPAVQPAGQSATVDAPTPAQLSSGTPTTQAINDALNPPPAAETPVLKSSAVAQPPVVNQSATGIPPVVEPPAPATSAATEPVAPPVAQPKTAAKPSTPAVETLPAKPAPLEPVNRITGVYNNPEVPSGGVNRVMNSSTPTPATPVTAPKDPLAFMNAPNNDGATLKPINQQQVVEAHTNPQKPVVSPSPSSAWYNTKTANSIAPIAVTAIGAKRLATGETLGEKLLGGGEIVAGLTNTLMVAKNVKGAGPVGLAIASVEGGVQISSAYDSKASMMENAKNIAEKTDVVSADIALGVFTGNMHGDAVHIIKDREKARKQEFLDLAKTTYNGDLTAELAMQKAKETLANEWNAGTNAVASFTPVQLAYASGQTLTTYYQESGRFDDIYNKNNIGKIANSLQKELAEALIESGAVKRDSSIIKDGKPMPLAADGSLANTEAIDFKEPKNLELLERALDKKIAQTNNKFTTKNFFSSFIYAETAAKREANRTNLEVLNAAKQAFVELKVSAKKMDAIKKEIPQDKTAALTLPQMDVGFSPNANISGGDNVDGAPSAPTSSLASIIPPSNSQTI